MNSLIYDPPCKRGRMCLVRCPECRDTTLQMDTGITLHMVFEKSFNEELEAAIDKIAQRMVEGDPDGGE